MLEHRSASAVKGRGDSVSLHSKRVKQCPGTLDVSAAWTGAMLLYVSLLDHTMHALVGFSEVSGVSFASISAVLML